MVQRAALFLLAATVLTGAQDIPTAHVLPRSSATTEAEAGTATEPAIPPPLLVDDLESYHAYEQWTIAGGPEASAVHDSSVKRSGKYSIRFQVNVDHKTGGNPEYPQGWLFLNRTFKEPQDWSAYKALEFHLRLPRDYPIRSAVLKVGVQTEGGVGRMVWRNVSPETLAPGDWARVILPLRRGNVDGELTRVTQIRFYVAENWYDHGDRLILHLDDVGLLKDVADIGGSEWIRAANTLLQIPESYQSQREPVIYPVVPLEFIYADTDLSKRDPARGLNLTAAQGEVTALTFAVLAGAADVHDLTIEVSNLKTDAGKVISASRFDPRVVKVWKQAALHWEVFSAKDAILVPELLLRDDRVPIDEKRDETKQYIAPHVLDVPFGTDIPAHTLKQVWINVSIPDNAHPGAYQGVLELRAGGGFATSRLAIALEVLPFRLPDPKHTFGIYYRWRPDSKGSVAIPDDRFLADLRELKAAGFNSLSCYDPGNLDRWLAAMKTVGMRGPIVVLGGRSEESAKKVMSICRNAGMACYFYGVDEPNSKEKFELHKQLSALQHRAGGRVMTAIVPRTAQELKEQGEGLDWANHAISNGHSGLYLAKLRAGTTKPTAPFETYYWQVYLENPTRNRLFCGFYLWSSGLQGAFPYEYQCPPAMLPYTNDTRQTMHNVKAGGKQRTFRSWFLTYPSQEGPVSTLQWEGCRHGINDVRYLTYLEQMIEQLDNQGNTEAAGNARAEMTRIVSDAARLPPDPSVHTNPYVPPATFTSARAEMVSLIRKLRTPIVTAPSDEAGTGSEISSRKNGSGDSRVPVTPSERRRPK